MKEIKLLVQRAGLRFVQAAIGVLLGSSLIGVELAVWEIAAMAGSVAALQVLQRYADTKLKALPGFESVVSER